MSAVVSGNGLLVAVGDEGTILVSNDGKDWQSKQLYIPVVFTGLTFGNGRFVAVGILGRVPYASGEAYNCIYTSVNGHDWIPVWVDAFPMIYGRVTTLNNVTFGGGLFVAVGGNDSFVNDEKRKLVLISADGVNWQTSVFEPGNAYYEVASGNGVFVCGGYDGTIAKSSDGMAWTEFTTPSPFSFSEVEFGNGQFLVIGYLSRGNGIALTSTNGSEWATNAAPMWSPVTAMGFGNGRFVALGERGEACVSEDGITWTTRTALAEVRLHACSYADERYWAHGASGAFLKSDDGTNWVDVRSGFPIPYLKDISHGNGLIAAVGGGRPGVILTSTNSVDWVEAKFDFGSINGICFGAGKWVAVGQLNAILTSGEGHTWGLKNFQDYYANALESVAWGNGRFVAVGRNGVVFHSSDAESWNQTSIGDQSWVTKVRFLNGSFFATGWSSQIYRSSDGVAWASTNLGWGLSLTPVAFGNNRYVCLSGSTNVLISEDGINWAMTNHSTRLSPQDLVFGGNRFLAVGAYGQLASSHDGINWIHHRSPAAYDLAAACYSKGSFWAAGYSGTIVQSDFLRPTIPRINFRTTTPGSGRLGVTGDPFQLLALQSSSNLIDWITLRPLTNGLDGKQEINLELPTNQVRSFFRVVPVD